MLLASPCDSCDRLQWCRMSCCTGLMGGSCPQKSENTRYGHNLKQFFQTCLCSLQEGDLSFLIRHRWYINLVMKDMKEDLLRCESVSQTAPCLCNPSTNQSHRHRRGHCGRTFQRLSSERKYVTVVPATDEQLIIWRDESHAGEIVLERWNNDFEARYCCVVVKRQIGCRTLAAARVKLNYCPDKVGLQFPLRYRLELIEIKSFVLLWLYVDMQTCRLSLSWRWIKTWFICWQVSLSCIYCYVVNWCC